MNEAEMALVLKRVLTIVRGTELTDSDSQAVNRIGGIVDDALADIERQPNVSHAEYRMQWPGACSCVDCDNTLINSRVVCSPCAQVRKTAAKGCK